MKSLIIFLFLLLIISCQNSDRTVENYGDINQSPGGKNLTVPEEHRGGWERNECLLCHNTNLGLHRNPGSVIDADALNELIRTNGGSAYCLTCHGPNGIN